jgi:hypothetical protein
MYIVSATADNGCDSKPIAVFARIKEAVADAGHDTVIIAAHPFRMHASGGSSYDWLPALGLDNPTSAEPVAAMYRTT